MNKESLKEILPLIMNIIDEKYNWMIPIMKAYINGEDIEFYDSNHDKWITEANPIFSVNIKYRIKPKNEYIPFTYGTILEHKNRWIKHRICEYTTRIQHVNPEGITILLTNTVRHINYKDLFEDFIFENDDVCGIKNI